MQQTNNATTEKKQATITVVCPDCGYRAAVPAAPSSVRRRFGGLVFQQCNVCELEMAQWYEGRSA